MSWLKRNLYFALGSVVALALIGLAGWFLYSKWDLNNKVFADLNSNYEELRRLNSQPIQASRTNIALAREQRQQVLDLIKQARGFFKPVEPIPNEPKLTDQAFSSALSRTIAQLQRDATNASVILPPDYNFAFAAQKLKLSFAPPLEPLAQQLGEIKAICDTLFKAKINSLDDVRRERVSADDSSTGAPQTDYLPEHTVTNELVTLTPYEVVFRCFSSELASVLAGFASSPNGFIVKSVNVEPAPAQATPEPAQVTMTPVAVYPQPNPALNAAAEARQVEEQMRRRYGLSGDRYSSRPPPPRPQAQAPAYVPPPAGAVPPSRTGLPTVLDEKPLKVTLNIQVVKFLPEKEQKPAARK